MNSKAYIHKAHFKPLKPVLAFFMLLFTSVLALADVRVVMDVSKSMAENDPGNFRTEAIQLLLDSLPSGEKAGVWTFGQYVNLLVPHNTVNSQWRQAAVTAIRNQNAPATRTNIGRALEDVSYDFLFSSYRGPSHVVLITDGRVDIAPNEDVNRVERERILSQLVPKFVAANARIHTIAISEQADKALLRQMSEQTGGQFQSVDDTRNLSRVMAALAAEVSPASQLTLNKKSFNVDASIREITILMYHSSGAVALQSPDGTMSSAVNPGNQRWRVGNGFTQVSVSSPQLGRWQVNGQLEGQSSIRVLSDINLRWTEPEMSAAAKTNLISIAAELVDGDGKSIADDLASVITATLRVNGAVMPVQIQQDSIVARLPVTDQMDAMNLELNIDGGTFNRLITRQVRFVEPYISEVLMTSRGYEWRLYPNRLLSNVESINAMVEFDVMGQKRTEPFSQTDAGYWLWVLPYDLEPGQYTIQLSGSVMQDSARQNLPPESVTLSIPPAASGSLPMTPDLMVMPPMPANDVSDAFEKDPMPVFDELQAELVVAEDPNAIPWEDVIDDPTMEQAGDSNVMTYVLLSVPGILVLVIAYLFYRRLESKTKGTTSEDELIMGGDDFSDLDDMSALQPDADLDISSLEDDTDDYSLAEAPTIDDIIDEDLPTPEKTEAPSAALEDMLDADAIAALTEVDSDVTEAEGDEELFDISSIDDDLADLDLALDGDDPFADDEPEETKP